MEYLLSIADEVTNDSKIYDLIKNKKIKHLGSGAFSRTFSVLGTNKVIKICKDKDQCFLPEYLNKNYVNGLPKIHKIIFKEDRFVFISDFYEKTPEDLYPITDTIGSYIAQFSEKGKTTDSIFVLQERLLSCSIRFNTRSLIKWCTNKNLESILDSTNFLIELIHSDPEVFYVDLAKRENYMMHGDNLILNDPIVINDLIPRSKVSRLLNDMIFKTMNFLGGLS